MSGIPGFSRSSVSVRSQVFVLPRASRFPWIRAQSFLEVANISASPSLFFVPNCIVWLRQLCCLFTTLQPAKELGKIECTEWIAGERNFWEIKEKPTDKKVPLVEGGKSRWFFRSTQSDWSQSPYSTLQHCGSFYCANSIQPPLLFFFLFFLPQLITLFHHLADQFFTLTHQCSWAKMAAIFVQCEGAFKKRNIELQWVGLNCPRFS